VYYSYKLICILMYKYFQVSQNEREYFCNVIVLCNKLYIIVYINDNFLMI